ncbi:DUF4265 domain-containing protein [Bernardetia sp. Wsw4-3y2]|uniref:DUF4265 domain-containing protein n=1 Tax=Bernardetia sp. Wsw4-3y2 TaxID=3127471 RepID=UPI0030D12CB0
MSNYKKILFIHTAFNTDSIESAWGVEIDGGYRLENILFYTKNYSWNDIVSVKEKDGDLYVTGLLEEGGHSTINILFKDDNEVKQIRRELKEMGCDSELSNLSNLIALDIPPNTDYSIIKKYLDRGELAEKWEYQEACISSNHQ